MHEEEEAKSWNTYINSAAAGAYRDFFNSFF